RVEFERLGFTVPPRGSHIQWGTGNLCIMFPDDYLEVRGIIDASKFTMHLDTHLEEHGEGLMGVAFGTDNVGVAYQQAAERGIQTGELRQLTRNFEHPDGWTQPRFELFAPDAADIEGLMHVVVIQHLTPELLRRPEFLLHANTCLGIRGMAGTVASIDRTATKMRRLLGDAMVHSTEVGIELLIGDQHIRLSAADGDAPRLESIQFTVESLDAARAVLASADVAFNEIEMNGVRTEAAGTVIDFVQAESG
ncbi:MAG: VOC family protein, partial [Pseudomonadota bacterium]